MLLVWICVGGALGTAVRYGVALWLEPGTRSGFPVQTLAVNVTGSLLLAILLEAASRTDAIPPPLRLALGTGFLGGFTTYSTFNQDMLRMLRDAEHGKAALYLAATLLGGLAAGLLGAYAAARLAPPR